MDDHAPVGEPRPGAGRGRRGSPPWPGSRLRGRLAPGRWPGRCRCRPAGRWPGRGGGGPGARARRASCAGRCRSSPPRPRSGGTRGGCRASNGLATRTARSIADRPAEAEISGAVDREARVRTERLGQEVGEHALGQAAAVQLDSRGAADGRLADGDLAPPRGSVAGPAGRRRGASRERLVEVRPAGRGRSVYPAASISSISVASTSPPVRRAAAMAAAASPASSRLTGTSRLRSAFSRDSSLVGSKRLNRRCQSSSRSRARRTASRASPGSPSPITKTAQVEPKQANDSTVSATSTAMRCLRKGSAASRGAVGREGSGLTRRRSGARRTAGENRRRRGCGRPGPRRCVGCRVRRRRPEPRGASG